MVKKLSKFAWTGTCKKKSSIWKKLKFFSPSTHNGEHILRRNGSRRNGSPTYFILKYDIHTLLCIYYMYIK